MSFDNRTAGCDAYGNAIINPWSPEYKIQPIELALWRMLKTFPLCFRFHIRFLNHTATPLQLYSAFSLLLRTPSSLPLVFTHHPSMPR